MTCINVFKIIFRPKWKFQFLINELKFLFPLSSPCRLPARRPRLHSPPPR